MERGLYIAASGMLAEQARQDLIANDMANASTPGYKADRSSQRSFGDLLLQDTRTGAIVGPLGMGAQLAEQVTDLRPGNVRDTGEPLDLAITGDGFFGVQTDQGVRYTRNGRFMADGQGRMTDQLGNPVLGPNGQPIQLAADGTVRAGQVGVFAVANAEKVGEARFTGAAGGQANGSTVRVGALEDSGVDPARTMVDMMASMRAFEAGQRVIRTIDDTLAKAASQVGSVS
jgi:flagellar basal-body rod protein FlgG